MLVIPQRQSFLRIFSLTAILAFCLLVEPLFADRLMDRKVILCLGDSLTAGYGLTPESSYPSLLQKKIDKLGWDFRLVNAGVSGDTTAGGLRRLDWLLGQKVDLLILALGANDGLRGLDPEGSKKNLLKIIENVRAKYPKVRIIVAGMLVPLNMGEAYSARFKAIFPEVAKKSGASLIPFLLDGVAAEPEFNLEDGIHPNARGYEMVAENAWSVLKPVLQQMRESPEAQPNFQ